VITSLLALIDGVIEDVGGDALLRDLRALYALDREDPQASRADLWSTVITRLREPKPEASPTAPILPVWLPSPRMLKGHRAAEAYAGEVLEALGFSKVRTTSVGPDGGIDIVSDQAVAQVKMEALPTGRDRLQALFGAATVEGKYAVFFSLAGYTAPAIAWADKAGVALLEFGFDGSIVPANGRGATLLLDGAQELRPRGE
jgi:hypothetical protein